MTDGPLIPFTPNARYPDPAVEVLQPEFAKVRIDSSSVEQLASGCRWSEGPQWFADHGCLLWSDIPNNRIQRWDAASGGVTTFRSPSNHANGLALEPQGRLLTCEHLTRRITRTEPDGRITVLADRFDGKRLNSPNDIVCALAGPDAGSVWFTDPPFGIHGWWEGEPAAQELPQAVYRLPADGGPLQQVITDLAGPNGPAFSPDGTVLYGVESRAAPSRLVRADDVAAGSALATRRLQIDAAGAGALDGIAVDADGNLWCGWGSDGRPGASSEQLDGVRVFNPAGQAIGHIHLPERCANVCFGGLRRNRLFMAASHSLYALTVNVQGAACAVGAPALCRVAGLRVMAYGCRMTTTTLLVRQDALATTRLQTRTDAPLADGQVRVQIAHFALTSNNITYGAFGAAMQYWQFFPVSGDDAAGWGCIPVWGFGVVVQSLHPGVAVGERLWGYWPMASHAVLQPGRLSPQGFADTAAHRSALHAVYNQYMRCNTDPFYTADTESLQALLRPLYLTAWLIDDFLADNAFFGATAGAANGKPGVLLLSSASSKTAYATAARLALRDGTGDGVEVVGLTSPANLAFCQSLGVYRRVLTYAQLDAVAADTPCVYVDFAGNGALRLAVHSRFSELAYSCSIGGTHVGQLGGARDVPGPRATLFFAPAQVKKRNADWGTAEFGRRLVQDWHAFRTRVAAPAAPWLVVQHHNGPAAVQQAYAAVLGGRGDARVGHMLGFATAG